MMSMESVRDLLHAISKRNPDDVILFEKFVTPLFTRNGNVVYIDKYLALLNENNEEYSNSVNMIKYLSSSHVLTEQEMTQYHFKDDAIYVKIFIDKSKFLDCTINDSYPKENFDPTIFVALAKTQKGIDLIEHIKLD